MRPLHNKVIVERIPGKTNSAGGIVLKRSDEPDRAKIISVGPDVDDISVGEIVLLNWNAAIKAKGEQYIIRESDIVFVYAQKTQQEIDDAIAEDEAFNAILSAN